MPQASYGLFQYHELYQILCWQHKIKFISQAGSSICQNKQIKTLLL